MIWTTWIKGSSLLKGGKLFFPFSLPHCSSSASFLPSLPSFPQHSSPAPSLTIALGFIRVPGFHSLFLWHCINGEISYYRGNDFIPHWATPYRLLYLLHRARCCMQANWYVILKWLLLYFVFFLFKCYVSLSAFSVASVQGLLHQQDPGHFTRATTWGARLRFFF